MTRTSNIFRSVVLLGMLILTPTLALAAPLPASAPATAAAATGAAPRPEPRTSPVPGELPGEREQLAAREAAAPELAQFRGGDVVITTGVLVAIAAVVLLIWLL